MFCINKKRLIFVEEITNKNLYYEKIITKNVIRK
jgi:hypothetical protein